MWDGSGAGERAGDAQARRRFWARLEARAAAAVGGAGAPPEGGRWRGRSTPTRRRGRPTCAPGSGARSSRRRSRGGEAAARREAERREEAIQDDRYAGARARTNTPTTGK